MKSIKTYYRSNETKDTFLYYIECVNDKPKRIYIVVPPGAENDNDRYNYWTKCTEYDIHEFEFYKNKQIKITYEDIILDML